MSETRTCAVLVTYHSTQPLAPLLAVLRGQVARVVIVDNGSDGNLVTTLKMLVAESGDFVELILNAENRGLATAQNQGIRAALANGYEWVLLLDDDSVPDAQMVPAMLAAYAPPIGILAPRMVEQNVETTTRYLVAKDGHLTRQAVPAEAMLDDVATVIASGSLIHRDVFARVGLMREGLFIDYIDHDFCLRARAAGFTIRVVGSAILHHRQGNKTRHAFLGRSVVTSNYSAWRRYFMFRNRMFFLRVHGRWAPGFFRHELLACGWDIVRVVLFESGKGAKIGAALKGLAHGLLRPVPPLA